MVSLEMLAVARLQERSTGPGPFEARPPVVARVEAETDVAAEKIE